MGDTTISWCHRPGTRARTWNPTQGCALKSEGCRNCYAMKTARRFAGPGGVFEGLVNLKTGKWTGETRFAVHKLSEPLSWKEPSTVFVDSMSDLFYEGFTFEQIAAVYGVMAACPHHTFIVLTKRPARRREFFAWLANKHNGLRFCGDMAEQHGAAVYKPGPDGRSPWNDSLCRWPLPNTWEGVSVENQEAANERIPELLRTPAAIRFLSCEPLLGDVRLDGLGCGWSSLTKCDRGWDTPDERNAIDWVVAGCESGPGRRDCDVAWLRSLRDQCARARVPFFLKQARGVDGAYTITDIRPIPAVEGRLGELIPVVSVGPGTHRKPGGVLEGPYLDGVQHLEFPKVPA